MDFRSFQSLFNIPTRTLGGTQVWTDFVHFRGWRIQQNAVSKHFRLIDPNNVRHAWGNLEQCENRLNAIKRERHLGGPSSQILILIHGLGRSRNSMNSIAEALADREHEVVNFSYASTRASLDDHARALQSVIDHLPEPCQIDVVGHSLGNLVLRRALYLAELSPDTAPGRRLHRIVMLGPPNNGAELAKKLSGNRLFSLLMGRSATQIGELSGAQSPLELAVPRVEFGIIAGSGTLGPISNPWLDGENDFLVKVDETRLPGASDFLVLPVAHSYLLNDHAVYQATKNFLANGYFVSEEKRQALKTGATE